ncbi:MAG: potassium transporter TrkG, partial [Candidatus Hadarchaeales archaeon]
LGVILFYFASWPNSSLFEAVNHAMTAIATGGFSVKNNSFAAYGLSVKLVILIVMIWGATNFTVHDRVFRKRLDIREFFGNIEARSMLIIIAVSTLLLAKAVGWTDSLFQTTSALTGTGFSTANIREWGEGAKVLLIILMMIGGSYGSTSSAIKLMRIILLGKTLQWMLKKSFLPDRAVVPVKLAGYTYTEKEIMEILIYIFIYILVMFIGAGVLMYLGNPPLDSIFESASAQGNVGLSVGITSASMHIAGKISLTIQMLVGRLEILPVFALFSYMISLARQKRKSPF